MPSVGLPRASRPVRKGYRPEAGLLLFGRPEPAHVAAAGRRPAGSWRHPHLHRAVFATLRRPGAERGADRRLQGRPQTATSTPGPEYGRYPGLSWKRLHSTNGIVIAQVNELVDERVPTLPRVDIPGSWIDFVVVADKPFFIEPLFTRDPRLIRPVHILMAMMAIKGIYARAPGAVAEPRHRLQHRRHRTAAADIWGERLGLRGKICKHWTLNPHPTLIPAIECGWVESVHCFGGELGMEEYIARPARRVLSPAQTAPCARTGPSASWPGQYAVDMFIGSTLQVDGAGQLLNCHARPCVRLRRRAEHGPRPARYAVTPRLPGWT